MATKQKQTDNQIKPKSRVEEKNQNKVSVKAPPQDKSVMAKERKAQKKLKRAEKKKAKIPRRRIIPIWVRIIIVLLLCAGALALGAMVGYGIIGNGSPKDVFLKETWQHIIDFVTKKE